MGNQQVSYTEETFIIHPKYTRLEIGNLGSVRFTKNKKPVYSNTNAQGYLVIQIKISGKVKTLKVHRLVAEVYLPKPSDELIAKCSQEHHGIVLVRHLDNNKMNNRWDNLDWCDLETNTKQAWNDGLIPSLKGELNGRAILTEDIVHSICKDYEDGMTPKTAIEKYGISRQQATKIRAGFQWKHVSSQYNIKVNKRVKTSTISHQT